jgi:hypothetical protein
VEIFEPQDNVLHLPPIIDELLEVPVNVLQHPPINGFSHGKTKTNPTKFL